MVKKIFFGLVLLLLIFPIVSAAQTTIKVKTLPTHKVSVFVYSSGGLTLVESSHLESDIYGNVEVLYDLSQSKIDVLVKVTNQDNEKIYLHKFESYDTGGVISVRIDDVETNSDYAYYYF